MLIRVFDSLSLRGSSEEKEKQYKGSFPPFRFATDLLLLEVGHGTHVVDFDVVCQTAEPNLPSLWREETRWLISGPLLCPQTGLDKISKHTMLSCAQ